MIRHVMFDLDDTLCDFSGAKARGLANAFALLAPQVQPMAWRIWQELDPILYGHFNRHVLTRDGYRHLRFAAILSALGDARGLLSGGAPLSGQDLESLVTQLNTTFMTEVNDRIKQIDGAEHCLRQLASQGRRCHILTNGPYDGQLRKLEITGLTALIDQVFVSEVLGVSKPDPEVYRIALSRLDVSPVETVMIGDSFENDIRPARSVGMHAILYTPDTARRDCHCIHALTEVPHAIAALQQAW